MLLACPCVFFLLPFSHCYLLSCLHHCLQGVPMYACKYAIQGPTTNLWDGPAAAAYLARSISASGQTFCSAAPSSGFCGSTAGVTGFCAAAPAPAAAADAPLACTLLAAPPPAQMAVTLAGQALLCNATTGLSDAGAASLQQYIAALLPGFSVTLPAWSSQNINCTRAQVRPGGPCNLQSAGN